MAVRIAAARQPECRPCIRPIAERCDLPRDARRTARRLVRRQRQDRRPAGSRAVIRTSGPSSRRSWKIASTSATRIRRFSSSSRGEEDSPTLDLIDPLTLKAAGSASVDDLTKIGTNNHLRRILQTTLARFGLSSTDASVRLDAVRDIEQDLDEGNVQLLREREPRGNRIPRSKRKLPRLWRSPRWMVRMRRRVSPRFPRSATASARMC